MGWPADLHQEKRAEGIGMADQAFTRALERIPRQLRERPGARFTVILNGQKKPEGKDWSGPNGANYSINDAPLAGYLSQGHNYGVLCGHAGITIPDLDDVAALEELGVLQKIPETTKVKTGRGGLHVYLDCPELDHQIGIYHPTLKGDDGEPLHLGEIQSLGQQVVGPGSIHPNGNRYEVVNDAPILTISKADLLKIFDGLILTGIDDPKEEPRRAEARRRSSGGHSLGDLIPIDQVAWPKDIKERRGSEVVGTHPLHGSKGGRNFYVNTSKNSWHCFRHGKPGEHKGGGGPLEWLAVEAGLIRCEDAKPGCLDDKELFKKVLQIARDRGFYIPPPEPKRSEEPQGPTVLTALKVLLDHEDQIKGECLWPWRVHKPRIESVLKSGYLSQKGEEKAHKFLKQFKKALDGLGIDYDNLHPLLLKPKSNKEEFPEEIKAKALEILRAGDPVQYVADSCGRSVLGAEKAFKKLECCVSVQNVNQSAGLHPKFNGDSGSGKTFIAYAYAHHLPKEAVIKGSMSAKAGFYHKDGNRVLRLLDDYQAGNEDLDTVIKQTTSEFHEPYQHRTLIKQIAATLEIGSEQTWLITSVDASQDIQVLNRQIPINTDDSGATTKLVNDRTIKRYGIGEEQRPTDETVLICRAMFQILRDEGMINVRIPFWERIKWLDTSNRRNPSLFMDLVIAFTAMRRYQREKDSEGYYLAAEEDFTAAKELFTDNDAEELVKRLSEKERETLAFMISKPDGITQDDLAKHLTISRQRAGQIIYGQKGAGGLMGKVQIAETKLSEMKRINDKESRTIHKIVYSLKEYNRLAGFDAVVKLEPATVEPRKYDASKDASMDTASSKDGASIESKKEKEREEREIEDLQALSVDESLSLSKKANHTCNTCVKATDSDASTCGDTCAVVAETDFSPTETALLQRICGRMQKEGKELDPFVLALAMRSNDCDIGIQRCKAWIAATA